MDVAQDCVVTHKDCGTEDYITLSAMRSGASLIVPLSKKIFGRTSAKDVVHPQTGDIIVKKGELISWQHAASIEESGIVSVDVRSVLTCKLTDSGICASCYGRDLSRGILANVGEAVGVISAQSIGEPGTQLTLRTSHSGGSAQGLSVRSNIHANSGVISLKNVQLAKNSGGESVVVSRAGKLIICDTSGNEIVTHNLPYGSTLYCKDGDNVEEGVIIAEWDAHSIPVISEMSGVVAFRDIVAGLSINESYDEQSGEVRNVVSVKHGQSISPAIEIASENGEITHSMSQDMVITVQDGQKIMAGDIVARSARVVARSRDITGGLPRVSEIFEARQPRELAILSEISGRIEFGKTYKAKVQIIVTQDDGRQASYLVSKSKTLLVHEGDYIQKGDQITSGSPDLQDILRIKGVKELSRYMTDEIQGIYHLHGVSINDKHIEVIIRQMLRRGEITNPGDTTYLTGEEVDYQEFYKSVADMTKRKMNPPSIRPVLQGLTRASLTRSVIASASFQDTSRVIADVVTSASPIDPLKGIKENVVACRLIPAGTGMISYQLKAEAERMDEAIMKDRVGEE